MEEKPKYTLREPRKRPDGLTAESRRKMSEASKFARTDKTKVKMSEGRRKLFVKNNPLKEGEIYVSLHTSVGYKRVIVKLEDPMELSLDGEKWVKLTVTERDLRKAMK